MPADLARTISHAHTILGWQENLQKDEMPPEWMWSLDEELQQWFDEVLAKRANPAPSEDVDAPGMEQNALTKQRPPQGREGGDVTDG